MRSLRRWLDLRELGDVVRRRTWSDSVSFGLECREPAGVQAPRPAGIPVRMVALEATSFRGFHDELRAVSGGDALEVLSRIRMCEAGVQGLHVALSEDGRPIYAQWLIGPDEQMALHTLTGGLFPQLADGEVLLEGAYTFAAFRRLGAMSDGMQQLLAIAAQRSTTRCVTYVSPGNVASLRGCANAGFGAGHGRVTRARLGLRRYAFRPLQVDELEAWQAAVVPAVQPPTTREPITGSAAPATEMGQA